MSLRALQVAIVRVSLLLIAHLCDARQAPSHCIPFELPISVGAEQDDSPHLSVQTTAAAPTPATASGPEHVHDVPSWHPPHHHHNVTHRKLPPHRLCSPPGLTGLDAFTLGTVLGDPLRDLRTHLLDRAQLLRGVASTGRGGPFDRFVRKLLQGEPVHVALLGGSITLGHGSGPDFHLSGVEQPPWDPADPYPYAYGRHLFEWIKAAFPNPQHQFTNGAVAASRSSYIEICMSSHIPVADVDLVLLEYVINDGQAQGFRARSMERLIRKVLRLPRAPAVAMLNVWNFQCRSVAACRGHGPSDYSLIDEEYATVAAYYNLPVLSFQRATWQEAVLLNHSSFQFVPEGSPQQSTPAEREQYFLEPDRQHPNARGHRMLAQLLVHLIQQSVVEQVLYPLPADEAPRPLLLPPPYEEDNFPSRTIGCHHGQSIAGLVGQNSGWEMVDEAPKYNNSKYGYRSMNVGDVLQLKLDTRVFNEEDGSIPQETKEKLRGTKGKLTLGFLRSYEKMGLAKMSCIGCTCQCVSNECRARDNERLEHTGQPADAEGLIEIDGLWREKSTQSSLWNFEVSQSSECTIEIVNSATAAPRESHKLKLMSVMLSEGDPLSQFVDNNSGFLRVDALDMQTQ